MKLAPQRSTGGGDDLIPLINVIFLLLIFFLLAGTLTPPPAVPIDYVESGGRAVPSVSPDSLYVDAAGGAYLAGELLTQDRRGETLAALRQRLGEHLPLVLDRDLEMRFLQPLLRDLTAAGFRDVELVTVRSTRP